MFSFDKMSLYDFISNRIYFKSKTIENRFYYFEFSLKYLKFILNNNTTKWLAKF